MSGEPLLWLLLWLPLQPLSHLLLWPLLYLTICPSIHLSALSSEASGTSVHSRWHVLCNQARDHCRYLQTRATGWLLTIPLLVPMLCAELKVALTVTSSASARPNSAAEQLSQATLKMYGDWPEPDPRQDLADFVQCRSTDIVPTPKKRINALKDFRGNCWVKVCKKLKPIVQVLLWVTNTAGESIESIGIPSGNRHYLHGLILFSDDLKEALQKLDNFQKEMKTIMNMNTYTLVHVRELFPPYRTTMYSNGETPGYKQRMEDTGWW
ncbi:hypothetical protein DFH08DRAFT_808886 [Mycena albidolilacea]|uniref:Uncharacterized protein n=1 Tax=Mycena albidolilacea TaxID=1033008 RepID=A0AAD7A3J3_9AGAR|nr:hypothetical protein DFH08DRAFT_808886 [Mycena albidolilacea]